MFAHVRHAFVDSLRCCIRRNRGVANRVHVRLNAEAVFDGLIHEVLLEKALPDKLAKIRRRFLLAVRARVNNVAFQVDKRSHNNLGLISVMARNYQVSNGIIAIKHLVDRRLVAYALISIEGIVAIQKRLVD